MTILLVFGVCSQFKNNDLNLTGKMWSRYLVFETIPKLINKNSDREYWERGKQNGKNTNQFC